MKNKNLCTLISLISIFVLLTVFPAYSQIGKAPPPIDSAQAATYYLEMKGTINRFVPEAEKGEKLPPLGGASIHVFYGTTEYATTITNDKGKCTFNLPLNRIFKVQVSKYGYVTKFFEVNTKVPAINLGKFSFNFDVDLFEEIKKLDVNVLKKPIAKVTFDVIYDRFQYDESYTGRINFDIKKMYKSYYELQKAQTDSIARYKSGKPAVTPPDDSKKKTPPGKTTPPKK